MRRICLGGLVLGMLLVFYVASAGPALWLWRHEYLSERMLMAYAPATRVSVRLPPRLRIRCFHYLYLWTDRLPELFVPPKFARPEILPCDTVCPYDQSADP